MSDKNDYRMTESDSKESLLIGAMAHAIYETLSDRFPEAPMRLAIAAAQKFQIVQAWFDPDNDFDQLIRGLVVSLETNAQLWKTTHDRPESN